MSSRSEALSSNGLQTNIATIKTALQRCRIFLHCVALLDRNEKPLGVKQISQAGEQVNARLDGKQGDHGQAFDPQWQVGAQRDGKED